MNDDRRCSGLRKDGGRCNGPRLPGRPTCLFHTDDPEMVKRRAAGRKAGGKARSRPAATLPGASDLPLQDAGDVAAFLGRVANECRQGKLDARVGNCLSAVASALLRALEGSDVNRRLDAMEERLRAALPTYPLGVLP
jgi:hypothetical protein